MSYYRLISIMPKSSVDPDAQAFITAAAITNPTQQQAINTLVVDLKGYGIWSKMKAIYPFVGGTASTHKFNLKDPRDLDAAFRLTFFGGIVHDSNGVTGNGTNGYFDTYYNDQAQNLLNDVSGWAYSRNNIARDGDVFFATNDVTNLNVALNPRNSTNNAGTRLHNNINNSTPNSDSRGLFGISRLSSANYGLFIRNVKTNITQSSISLQNSNILGLNFVATSTYSQRNICFMSLGLGLTDTEAANLYTLVQTYQTTLGRSIGTQTVSDPDAQAFVTAANIQDQVQADAVNNLTIGLKADGLWSKMKAIYPFVGGDATSHKFNLKNPLDTDAAFRLVFNGGWTHSANGVLPNGTNGYADTKLIPNTILDVNSTHTSIYSRTNLTSGSAVDLGCFSGGSSVIDLYSRFSSNNMLSRAYNTTYLSGAVSDSLGLFIVNRQASNLIKQHKNSSIIASNSLVAGTKPTVILSLGALNNSGSFLGTYSSRQYAFASIGDGLTDTEAANLYSRVQTYQTALNRQV